jgi:hypothetical protein
MQLALQITVVLLGIIALCSFVGAFVANLLLAPYFDRERARAKPARRGVWNSGNPIAPMEFYQEKGRPIWQMRDRCLKVFAICCGLLVIVALTVAIVGISLG